jgi:uncharacterized protein (DUF2235 family)
MAQKIVICSDGTGNSFSEQTSNVTRLIQYLDLSRPEEQMVFYDQGIGTDPLQVDAVQDYVSKRPQERCALKVLDPPVRFLPLRWVAKVLGLGLGVGLTSNVKQLYKALADSYEDGRSVIYLIGFSRGAFTVRVLAGLIHRCGLLRPNHEHFSAAFKEAYRLYKPHVQDEEHQKKVQSFKHHERVRTPCVRFLGIWDTVKSYGGIWPKSLPHLRRNPIVENVRHALALDEQRSWFIPTSWGGIDSDPPPLEQAKDCRRPQHVEEIWFRGSHSDIGGGFRDDAASQAPLRWMLNEAAAAGLRLNQAGREFAASSDPVGPRVHDSLTGGERFIEYLPRWELDNSTSPPKRFFKCGRTGARHPTQFARQQIVRMHSSVGAALDIVTSYVETKSAASVHEPRHDDEAAIT